MKASMLDGELFSTLHEAQELVERRRRTYYQIRPHDALGYRPTAPDTIAPQFVWA